MSAGRVQGYTSKQYLDIRPHRVGGHLQRLLQHLWVVEQLRELRVGLHQLPRAQLRGQCVAPAEQQAPVQKVSGRACRMAGLEAIIFCITSGFCSMDCMTGEFIMFASPSPCSGMPPRRSP